jgi:hypothetical protein
MRYISHDNIRNYGKFWRCICDTDEGPLFLKFDHEPTTEDCEAICNEHTLRAADLAQAELASIDSQISALEAQRPILEAKVEMKLAEAETLVAELKGGIIKEAPKDELVEELLP